MKNLNELRQALLDTVDDVRQQKITADDAVAISKNAQAVINLTRLELDYIMMKSTDKSDVKFLNSSDGNSKG